MTQTRLSVSLFCISELRRSNTLVSFKNFTKVAAITEALTAPVNKHYNLLKIKKSKGWLFENNQGIQQFLEIYQASG
jgi:hypothetical protein